MKLFDLSKKGYIQAGIVAFGFFDCIHLGHQTVIGRAVSLARKEGIPSSVFLFKNNIYELIGVKKTPVFTFEERVKRIADIGADQVLFVEADRDFLSLSPESYIEFLKDRAEISGFTCGKDFTFGKDGAGDAALLAGLLGGKGEIVDIFTLDGVKVSSEGVKTALLKGDMPLVKSYLGRDFSIDRTVISGRKEGEKMGFPTINLDCGDLKMRQGVYFTNTLIDGKWYRSVSNVGAHPTFHDDIENVESFVLDYKGDLYGKEVTLAFLAFSREIIRFNDVSQLIKRIQADVIARREYD